MGLGNFNEEIDQRPIKEITNSNIKETDFSLSDITFFDMIRGSDTRKKIVTGKTIISQSLIRQIIDKHQEKKEFCPAFIKCVYIDKKEDSIPTIYMLRGKFGEYLMLGSSGRNEKPTKDLPRKLLTKKKIKEFESKGLKPIADKRISQIRIETQAERFKIIAKERQIQIIPGINTHVPILKHWDNKYILSGELDLFPTPFFYEDVLSLAIVDIKITGNVEQVNGEYCWGAPKYLDHIQGDMYHYLVRDIDFNINPYIKNIPNINSVLRMIKQEQILFLYWIWGYKEPLNQQERIIERAYRDLDGTDYRQRELKERIRKTIQALEIEEKFGWQENPVPEICKKCPRSDLFGGDCKSSIIIKV